MAYKAFTKEEITAALPNGFEPGPGAGNEQTFVCRFRGTMVRWFIECYSGVSKGSEVSRESGADAIRFVLKDELSGKPVGKTTRVHRTGDLESLHERMLKRCQELASLAKTEEPLRCRKCGAVTVERKNKATGATFRGCSRWQDCKNSERPSDDGRQTSKTGGASAPSNFGGGAAGGEVSSHNPPFPSAVPPVDYTGVPTAELADLGLTYPWPTLNPFQSSVFPFVRSDVNVIAAAPTSAGKTVVAEMMIADALLRGKKAIFLSPLKAVTQEKFDEWTQETFKDRAVSIVTGDYQLTPERQRELAAADIILLTSEMLDSRTRRMAQEKNEWLYEVGVLVCDEAHLITMEGRGHALESGLMRFTLQNSSARVVLLSATMPNVDELGAWLTRLNEKHTELCVSDWRPVPHTTHYLPHPSPKRARYWDVKNAQLDIAVGLATREFPEDRWLMFVHEKTTGRALLEALRRAGVNAEFHSADLDRETRLRVEAEFRSR